MIRLAWNTKCGKQGKGKWWQNERLGPLRRYVGAGEADFGRGSFWIESDADVENSEDEN